MDAEREPIIPPKARQHHENVCSYSLPSSGKRRDYITIIESTITSMTATVRLIIIRRKVENFSSKPS
jgi:hypothetical protein